MFIVSKLFTSWFLLPGLFVTLLFLTAVSLFKKKNKGIAFIMLFFAGLIYCASIEPLSDKFIIPLENRYNQLNLKDISKHDVYVVLGGGVYDNSPDLNKTGSPSGDTLARIVYAYRLYRFQALPIIVSSGKGFACKKSEAPIMERYLMQMGVPERDIIMDSTSRNTYENANAVKQICEKLSCEKIILITSAYHMQRAMYAFKHVGLKNVIPAPTDYKTNRSCYNFMSYMPNMGAFINTDRALHEYIGLLYYRLLIRI